MFIKRKFGKLASYIVIKDLSRKCYISALAGL